MGTSGAKMELRIARLNTLIGAGPLLIAALAAALPAFPEPVCQMDTSESSVADGTTGVSNLLCLTCPGPANSHILGIVPNYRTASALAEYKPLTAKQKFTIAFKESTDPGTFVLAAAVGAISQARNSNPSFGEELGGYSHYAGTRYADYVISDFMRVGIFPSLLHQDPRYFRRGTGSGWSRVGYAVSQVFWTHSDSGRMEFNYSQTLGGATAVAISTAYSPETRDGRHAMCTFGAQLGAQAASNVMREFWPDLQRTFFRKRFGNHP